MRRFLSVLTLVTLIQSFPIVVSAQVQPQAKQSSDPIQMVLAANWMTNYPDNKFYPERIISRADLASIMVKAFRLDKRQATSKENFVVPDVPPSHPAYKDIQTVLKTDIMRGYRGNLFFPNQRVTRAEALAIFAQAYGVFQFSDETVNEILAPHPDAASIPPWARKAIATVVAEAFVNTDTQGNIYPLKPMTRGDMAYVLSKYLQRQGQDAEIPDAPPAPPQP
ncbi:S-layer protein [Fischerella thermalis CCMEE 5282]|uniref:S-layer homology domain-containing protein n=1 Tax=Fischerella thermalis TaxID=372787 RepID=UPI000C80ED7C|nr:S-layer homology domain-containing protein [Fischerella thermalis]PMB09994.1 S-layer protein [Fischerella thermalis CCMEE 5282]